jgi:GTP diphosphokinase / guanosine-3',5'-bis(diphosphate) 3'-diphosphatase
MNNLSNYSSSKYIFDEIKELLSFLGDEQSSKLSLDDRRLIWLSYKFAEASHKNQTRKSGEPYIVHPLEVAKIVYHLGMDAETIAASLLHDVVEDTDIPIETIKQQFGEKIAILVDGVTKLTKYDFPDEEKRDAAGIRKLLLAMISDVRVVIIKLADRLHNLRTLNYLSDEKRKRISTETLEIYAPIAERLGIWKLKSELEDISFFFLEPDIYADISKAITKSQSSHKTDLINITEQIRKKLLRNGFEEGDFNIEGRQKHIYSIYKKMNSPKYKNKGIERIYDKIGIRIILKTVKDCYAVLGLIHSEWRLITGEFDDYIGTKPPSGYQSLHTTVQYGATQNEIIEFQIRTSEMHYDAEYGVAAHWKYKEKGEEKKDTFVERRIAWLRQMLNEQQAEDPETFIALLKSDTLQDRLYIFTPRGDIIDLPAGSTPIDFAYHVHTDIGHCCRGARVNGKLVPLYQELKTGDQVEILTAKRGVPSRDWLNPNLGLVRTQRARSKIKLWFKKQEDEQNLAQGRDTLERELQRLGLGELNFEKMARELNYKTPEEMFIELGNGELSVNKVIKQFAQQEEAEEIFEVNPSAKTATSTNAIEVVGLKGMLSSMARCCNPMPGDPVVGFITRGRGATIHRQDCPNILQTRDRERLLQVGWGHVERTYPVPIKIKAYDRQGLVSDISNLLSDENINIADVKVNVNRSMADLRLVIEVKDLAQLSRILARIENLPNVMEAHRVNPG